MLGLPADMKDLMTLFLIAGRFGGVMATAPAFSNRHLPARIRMGFALLVAFVLTPLHRSNPVPSGASAIAAAMTTEVLVGIAIGFAASLVFMAVQVAGEITDMSAGFTVSMQFNPALGIQASVLAQLQVTLATLLFLAIDGHHSVIAAAADSFRVLPLGAALSAASAARSIDLAAELFSLGVRMALPAVISLMLTDVALSMIARTAPQINLFTVGIPLKMGVGLLAVLAGFPVFVSLTTDALRTIGASMLRIAAH